MGSRFFGSVLRLCVVETSTAITKFRLPRLRGDTVARASLLEKLQQSVKSNPVTLVCAPGGSGKTVLVSQLAASLADKQPVLWIALDADDNNANRLFAALVQAVEPLKLTWEADPLALIAGVAAGSAQVRVGLAALVNALCTSSAPRILIVLDDLHRLDNADAHSLLDSFIERLPEHVALVLSTRIEPALGLARWRAHGELGEFTPAELRFAEGDARALLRSKTGRDADASLVQGVLARTDGWAVGVSMLIQSTMRSGANTNGAPSLRDNPHLFSYLAQEVFRELPSEHRAFVLRASILDELNPKLCAAVTGREDSRDMLRDLYRRNLFLTAIDEHEPVLRFHDLFRDFLQLELERTYGSEVAQLHVRAAAAEPVPSRAVQHCIAAKDWPRAIALIGEHGERMIAEGAVQTLQRWFEQLPAAERTASPQIAFLNGYLAWLDLNWPLVKRELPVAIAGLTAAQEIPRRVRALFLLVDAHNNSGDLLEANARLDEVAQLPLDDLGKAELALTRAWCLAADSDAETIAGCMSEFVDFAARDPARICPATVAQIHVVTFGTPGVVDAIERFVALAERVREPIARPWQIRLDTVDGWARVWRGDRVGAEQALQRAESQFQQFRGIRLMAQGVGQYRTLLSAQIGDLDTVDRLAMALFASLDHPELAAHRAAWGRPHRHAHARTAWVHDDHARWQRYAESLGEPRTAVEWPFLDVAARVVRGQRAIIAEDWPTAIANLKEASRDYPRMRMPMIYCDPRISLAYAHLASGDPKAAWREFAPVLEEAQRFRAVGGLLFDSRKHVAKLLDSLPGEIASKLDVRALRDVLARWWVADPDAPKPSASTAGGRASVLSEREREVLELVASGASNKIVARKLDLSLHTVKRHICNILDKLDCDSRGQAADWWRRAS